MPLRFTVELSGIRFLIDAQFDEVYELCREYRSNEPAEKHIAATALDLEAERTPGWWSDGYLETLAVYRQMAEWLPLRDRILVHGAAVAVDGAGYLFCAPSGTGKSTHVALWREHLGSAVTVINGDKPLIHVPPGGPAVVYGTPWAGKEGWQCNMSAPLVGICFLEQGSRNTIRSLKPHACLERAMRQVYLPANADAALRTLEMLDELLKRVRLFELACDCSEAAVKCSFEGMTGLRYEASKQA